MSSFANTAVTLGLGVLGYSSFKRILNDSSQRINALGQSVGKLANTQVEMGRFRDLGQSLRATHKQLGEAQTVVQRLAMEMKAADQPTRQLQVAFDRARGRAAALKQTFQEQKDELRRLKAGLDQAGVSTRELGRHQKRLALEAERATRVQARLGELTAREGVLRQRLGGYKSRLVGGLAAGYGAARLMQAPAAVEKAKGEVASLGVSEAGLTKLAEAGRKFSNKWVGVTQDAFISAAYDIKSGVSSLGDTALAEVTRVAALTAKGTKAEAGEMTSLFAQGYDIFRKQYEAQASQSVPGWNKLSTEQKDIKFFEAFSGGIAATVQAYKTDGSKLSQAFQSLGADATKAGVTLAEQLAVLGKLQGSVEPGAAGTLYRAFLKNAAKGGNELGLDFVNAQTGQLRSLPEILGQLRQAYGDTIDETEKAEITKAFGTEDAVRFLALLYDSSADLAQGAKALDQEMKKGTERAEKMAAAMDRGPGATFERLGQQFGNLATVLGTAMAPAVDTISAGIGTVVVALQDLGRAFPKITGLIGAAVTGLAGAFAVVTAGGFALNAAKLGWTGFQKVLTLGRVGNPTALGDGPQKRGGGLGRIFRRGGGTGRPGGGGSAGGPGGAGGQKAPLWRRVLGGVLGGGAAGGGSVVPVAVTNWPGGGAGSGLGLGDLLPDGPGGEKAPGRGKGAAGAKPRGILGRVGQKMSGLVGRAMGWGRGVLGKSVAGGLLGKVGGGVLGKAGKWAGSLFKGLGKGALKKIPLLGAAAGGLFALQRVMGGDYLGAALELGSGLASTIPGVGTAVSLALDAAGAVRDAAPDGQAEGGAAGIPAAAGMLPAAATGLLPAGAGWPPELAGLGGAAGAALLPQAGDLPALLAGLRGLAPAAAPAPVTVQVEQQISLAPGLMRDAVEQVISSGNQKLVQVIREVMQDLVRRDRRVSFGYGSN
ncbi:MAG: phage tail tape measure protein [Deltaproteobacteria bacterium]|nr:phage tail tape measure protein [Deltaproteobacteria bacterium]